MFPRRFCSRVEHVLFAELPCFQISGIVGATNPIAKKRFPFFQSKALSHFQETSSLH